MIKNNPNYWRIKQEYTEKDINSMTRANIVDLLVEINLAMQDNCITKTKASQLLLWMCKSLTGFKFETR